MKKTFVLGIMCVCCMLGACTKEEKEVFALGADMSWLTEQEADGVLFYNDQGESEECMALLKAQGMNSVRLRVWVDHATGWCNKEDVIAKAVRATQLGLKVMVDFHYSDNFADPAKQTPPHGWEEYDMEALCAAVAAHTQEVLEALIDAGVQPAWVQVGNETRSGMLWPLGELWSAEQGWIEGGWARYARLTTAGYEAVKKVCKAAQVIVHVDNAYKDNTYFYANLKAHGGQFDMIGLSHYPMMKEWSGLDWPEMNRQAAEQVQVLIDSFACPVMICEVGIRGDRPEVSQLVMQDFVNRMEQVKGCKGIFYWEPQVYGGWRPQEFIPLGWGSYPMGSFTEDGRPNRALKILFRTDSIPLSAEDYERL